MVKALITVSIESKLAFFIVAMVRIDLFCVFSMCFVKERSGPGIILGIVIIACFTFSMLYYTKIHKYKAIFAKDDMKKFIVPKTTPEILGSHPSAKNRTVSSGDRRRLIYNRIPKCGSTTFFNLLKALGKRNKFNHFTSNLYHKRHLTVKEQLKFVKKIKRMKAPMSMDRHIYYINFTQYEMTQPLYINVIRDPVERLISAFYYVRKSALRSDSNSMPSKPWLDLSYERCVKEKKKECQYKFGRPDDQTLMTPYFCGQAEMCRMLGNYWALNKAKYNIENHYAVVGVLEEMNKTLVVLEKYIPSYFSGASSVYKPKSKSFHRNSSEKQNKVSSEVKEMVKKTLSTEYELYRFVLQRLNLQYKKIHGP
ncbi:Heparan sulfate 2-O-sulfotransferase 1 [Nymphon striatum]|nr:Heparan sulfate 2-O-sulfotransferase 1 [Nymphon striatum]